MTIRCEIVSQDRQVYSGEADIVVVPGSSGMMGILPHHAPTLTTMQFGIITVRLRGEEQHFTVAGGVVEVLPEQVTILADAAENVLEIDEDRAAAARKRAEELLANSIPDDPDTYLALQAALRRSMLREEAVRRFRQGKQQRPRSPQ